MTAVRELTFDPQPVTRAQKDVVALIGGLMVVGPVAMTPLLVSPEFPWNQLTVAPLPLKPTLRTTVPPGETV